MYERVHKLSLAIANASGADDHALCAAHYESLLEYFHGQSERSCPHPFLTEALADFTENPAEAICLYKLSLEQSNAFPNEPLNTKLTSLAERLTEIGQAEEAETCLADASTQSPSPLRKGPG